MAERAPLSGNGYEWAARAGWNLTSERIGKSPEGLDMPALLDRLEAESWSAPLRFSGQ